MAKIVFVIDETLDKLGITKNHLAVEAKIRPATLHEMSHGKSQALKLETLTKILETLNTISKEKGQGFIDIKDVINYVPDENE